ncbi:hypothetical protein BS78_06G173400 [Paspalum vaginatum]|nr:hypothetical protein BS78_06G173400 [Paspalum vaginatum]
MPPPSKPYFPSGAFRRFPMPDSFDIDSPDIDPDYRYFLQHVREDGDSYALVIPSEDGVSPPVIVRYEQPLAGHNAGSPVGFSESGGKGAPAPAEEDACEAPRGVASPPHAGAKRKAPDAAGSAAKRKRKAPDASPAGGSRRGAAPREEEPPAPPVVETAWYDSHPDIDEDYRLFLRNHRVVNGDLAVKMGGFSATYGDARSVDDDTEEEKEEEEEEAIPASEPSVEDGVGSDTEEGENLDAEKEEEGIDSDFPIVKEVKKEVDEEEVGEEDKQLQEVVDDEEEGDDDDDDDDEEEDEDEEGEEEVGAVGMKDGVEGKGIENIKDEYEGEDEGPRSYLQIVNEMEYELKEEVEEVAEKPLDALVRGITESEPLNREASSTKGNPTTPHNASELQGCIWPPHIIERPDSDFKAKLLEVLIKPFNQEEYDRYVDMVTSRTPVVKERRTRQGVAYYPWRHEMGKSYFDNYPDLAEQFNLQVNNVANRLALLRGFFFWLKNFVGSEEDQFRPWSNDFKSYRIVVESSPYWG